MQENSRLVKSRLRDLRKKQGLTQVDIAGILGTTLATYSRYEKGMFKLESGLLCKLAEYYDVSVDYILLRANDPRMYKERSDNYIEFSMKYNDLDEEKKELLTAIINAMLERKAE